LGCNCHNTIDGNVGAYLLCIFAIFLHVIILHPPRHLAHAHEGAHYINSVHVV
jgi:hypothetical protein